MSVPAVRDPMLERFREFGYWLSLAESGDKSPKAKGAAAAIRFAFADALGLSPLAATEISTIGGRIVVGAKLARALAGKAGYRVVRAESDESICTAVLILTETGEEIGRTTYTIEDAKRAGLVKDGSGYKKDPARMLWARASKRVIDDFAPEVSLGLVTLEEAEEIAGQDSTGSSASGERAEAVETGEDSAGVTAPAESSSDEEAEWTEITAEEEIARERAHFFAVIGDFEEKGANPVVVPEAPEGKSWTTWDEFSHDLAVQLFEVQSRGDLRADEWRKLRIEVEKIAAPFS